MDESTLIDISVIIQLKVRGNVALVIHFSSNNLTTLDLSRAIRLMPKGSLNRECMYVQSGM